MQQIWQLLKETILMYNSKLANAKKKMESMVRDHFNYIKLSLVTWLEKQKEIIWKGPIAMGHIIE